MTKKQLLKTLLIAATVFFTISCEEDITQSSPVIETEKWHLIDEYSNYVDLTISLHEDSSLSCFGKWKYYFWSDTIICTSMSGSSTKKGDSLFIVTNGKAAYPPDNAGVIESSRFSMSLDGVFNDSVSSGIFGISFANSDWKSSGFDDGEFTGSLESGEGITE